MFKAPTVAAVAAVVAVAFAALQADLATINVPQAVLADGKVLVAGTYDVRVTNQAVTPAPGESEGAERWLEFVANGVVAGREVATVVPDAEIENVADGPRPKPNTSRVDLLKGGDFLRVWINRDGVNYLIHLPLAR